MVKRSIRWRLVVSFGGLALLVTLALGALLLGILRTYYRQQEQRYLMRNAYTISVLIASMVRENSAPEALQTQLEGLTFLTQTRIRLLDPQRQVLADSGPFSNSNILILSASDGSNQAVSIQLLDEGVSASAGPIQEFAVALDDHTTIGVFSSAMTGETSSDLYMTMTSTLATNDAATPPDISGVGAISVAKTLYGYDLGADVALIGTRSEVIHSQPIWANDALWGYVELSEGPAYGALIVNYTLVAWGIASVLSVLLAAGVGWLMSRSLSAPLVTLTGVTSQMAAGDLTSRAPATARSDEVGMLSRAFNQMADRVEETVSTLREFVSDAAHELHTPLTALRTNLELAGASEAVVRAQAQVNRLEALTAGLLDLSRIEAGAPEFAPVDVTALSREVAELYASQAEQADSTFTVTTPDAPVRVSGNAAHLSRALTNLLDNALKFTPAGGAVQFSLAVEDAAAVIRVEDTGIGIPEADLPHLFNRFHRGRNTAGYPGSGLGLAIVRAIVESHGGEVQAENTTAGARFTVRLLLLQNALTAAASSQSSPRRGL